MNARVRGYRCLLRREGAKGFEDNSAVVGRLFVNHREAERAYWAKTCIFPIMHTLVMHRRFHEQHPWVADSIYKACERAKEWCLERTRFSGALRYMLPWLLDEIDEMDGLFGDNPWPYGVEPNRRTLEMMSQFPVDQGFIEQDVDIGQMFVPIVSWAE